MGELTEHQEKALRERTESGARGLLLGLALGETLGAVGAAPAPAGTLRAGVCTQLACFTVEGSVRAMVRGSHKGICHPPSVLWHAYCRWSYLQGLERERVRERWDPSGTKPWPDGWLAGVPALAERRGSAPATVAVLSGLRQGTFEEPANGSRGWHAVGRTLPLALLGSARSPRYARFWGDRAREVAALTHGDAGAQWAAACATVLGGHCLAGDSVRGAAESALAALGGADGLPGAEPGRLAGALGEAVGHPAQPARLARLAPDPTAWAALLGGLYAAASFPGRGEVAQALRFAATAPDGESVACVAGALLGAVHGAQALPVELVSRHELAWVLDTLARDVLAEVTDSPGGSEYVAGRDPYWLGRYPGW
ncbi:ADP-ribosylglycohydrolase family protein [Streptomyces sp. NBC_00091]|uniref:ADP-ribosylglycohydrolase family protein n=1 Tax=Streptomyces sp. NBC_00091 TaxID=2975648 RepID=UPI00225C3AB7|nr:ADP-ribosylglycohydrolase family protein [Streptomyces sp. NBC_00091]MCX5380583.1 ADP-ribosylglycohydrolase family protein [Streptomyces sp. NBC_00091]